MNNNHSPFSVHNLNPNLVGQVEDAYQRNIEAGRVVDDEFTGVVAKESLSDVMARIKKNLTSHEHAEGGALAEQITNHETLAAFESAFQDTTKLFDRISVSAPRPEDLESGGVEFYKLAELYEDMEQQGLEPQIVIAPHQDNQSMWTDLYGELVNDKDLYWSTGRKDEEQSVWFAPLI